MVLLLILHQYVVSNQQPSKYCNLLTNEYFQKFNYPLHQYDDITQQANEYFNPQPNEYFNLLTNEYFKNFSYHFTNIMKLINNQMRGANNFEKCVRDF